MRTLWGGSNWCNHNPQPIYTTQTQTIYVQGTDGAPVKFPYYFEYISEYVFTSRNIEGGGDTLENPIFVPYSQRVLDSLKQVITLISHKARNIYAQKVAPKDINSQTIFPSLELTLLFSYTYINPEQRLLLAQLYHATFYLRMIPPFVNAIASVLAREFVRDAIPFVERELQQNAEYNASPLIIKQLMVIERALTREGFGEKYIHEIGLMYIRKYLYLKSAENTVADLLAEKGIASVIQESSLTISGEKKITSLYGLERIPVEIAEKIEDVYLTSNNIIGSDIDPDYPSKPFSNFPNIQFINLLHNHITNLPETMFEGISKLEALNLSANNISLLPPLIFSNLAPHAKIDLSSNFIVQAEGEFRQYYQLKPSVTVDLMSQRSHLFDF